MASAPNVRLLSLQAGRGLAALAVVAFHTGTHVKVQVGPLPAVLAAPMAFGYLGVDFFFVLSGFIIYFTSHEQAGQPGWAGRFLHSRLSRIFLPYWPVAICLGLLYLLFPDISQSRQTWDWFTTLTLLPTSGSPALRVAWTLQHELVFYALALACLATGQVLAGACVSGVAILFLTLLGSGRWLTYPLIDLEFLFGVAAAWWIVAGKARWNILPAVAGLALVALYIVWADRYFSVLFGLGVALVLVAAVRLEQTGRIHVPRAAAFLGDASYAIYLVHLPLISIVDRLAGQPLLAALLCVTLSVAAGAAYHLAVERPLLRAARGRLRRRGIAAASA